MSNNAQSNIVITFEGKAQSLDDALKSIRTGLGTAGTEATTTGDKLAKMSDGEAKAAHEARNMGEAVKVAADTVGLLGIESGESYIRLQSLRHGVTDFTASMGGLKAGLIGGIGLGAAFGGIQFLHEAVVDSIAGEQATNQLQAALRKTPGAFEATNTAIEKSSTTWAKFGISVGVLKAAVAQGVGAGIKPETIIGQPGKIADLAKALGEDVPTALGEIERGGRGAQRVISRLNLSLVEQRRTMQQLANPNMSANDRTQFLLNRVQQTAFAGQGEAGTKGAQGQIAALDASLADLKETVGTSLLPVLTDMVSTFTGMIQGANSMLSAVGGLGTFLQATWKPALIGISTIFLGLKISHSALGDFIRSRLLGDVSAAAGGFAEEAVQATKASDAIGSIPPVVRTIAMFTAKDASVFKDAYLLNLSRIPGALIPGEAVTPQPLTIPVFQPQEAEAQLAGYESQLATIPASIPTDVKVTTGAIPTINVAGNVTSWNEAGVPPIQTTGTIVGWTEAAAAPVNVTGNVTSFTEGPADPVNVVGKVTTWAEAAATPVDTTGRITSWTEGPADPVNVVGKVTGWTEAAGTPVSVTGKVTGWTEAAATTVSTKGKITGWTEAAATTVSTKGKITAWSEPAATSVSTTGKVTSWDEGHVPQVWATGKVTSWDEGHIPTVKTTGTVTSLNLGPNAKLNVGGTDAKITPQLDANSSSEMTAIRSTLKTEAGAGGAIPITVKPQWASNAVAGLKAGIAGGVALAITDAIFNSVTIKQASGTSNNPFASSPPASGRGSTSTHATAGAPLPVKIVDAGPIGSALGFPSGHKGPEALNVNVVKIPGVHIAADAKIAVSNFPANPIAATSPTGSTVKLPSSLDVKAHQSGGWTVSLSNDALGRFAQVVGEVALGSALGSVIGGLLGKLPFGGMVAALKGLVTKGGKDGTGGGGLGSTGDILGEAEALIAKSQTHGGAAPATPSSSPIHYKGTEHVTSLQDVFNTALKTLQIGAPLGAVLYGAFRSGGVIKAAATGLAGAVDGAFASIIALISFPIKGLQTTKGKSTGPTVAAAYAGAGLDLEILSLGKAVVEKFSDGVKAGWTALTQRISALFNDLVNAIIKPINDVLSHIPGTHPIPLAGAHTSSSSSHGGSKGTGFNLASINPAVLHPPAHVMAHHAPVAHHTTHQQVTHHTTVTNHVTVNESKTPRETGDAVLKALSAAAQRKKAHAR